MREEVTLIGFKNHFFINNELNPTLWTDSIYNYGCSSDKSVLINSPYNIPDFLLNLEHKKIFF